MTCSAECGWASAMIEYSGVTVEGMMPCATEICKHVSKRDKGGLRAIESKFKMARYSRVSEEAAPVL